MPHFENNFILNQKTLNASHRTSYICDTMKWTLIYIILAMFTCSTAFSQNENWEEVKDNQTGISIKMPQTPSFNQENRLTVNGVVTKEIYTTTHKDIELVFEIQAVIGDDKKANVQAINNALKLVAIQNQGTQRKKQSFKKDGFLYNYSETPLMSGNLIRSIVFVYQKKLIHIYVKGNIIDVFDIDANYYLESWNIPNVTVLEENKKEKKDKTNKKNKEENIVVRKTDFDWEVIQFGDKIEVEFPGNPFKKQTFINRSRSEILIAAYSYTSIQDRLVYVATKRKYSNDEGQLSDEALYDYMTERMVANKKIKKPKEIESEAGRQYISTKFFKASRLKLIRINNIMYQFLVIGKRKNIYSDEVEYFFNQTNTF